MNKLVNECFKLHIKLELGDECVVAGKFSVGAKNKRQPHHVCDLYFAHL